MDATERGTGARGGLEVKAGLGNTGPRCSRSDVDVLYAGE